jgi:hypothetical protein
MIHCQSEPTHNGHNVTAMSETNELAELRRLVQKADEQIAGQIEVIDRMRQAGIPTLVAEEALRSLRRTASDLYGRLKVLTAA